MNNLWWRLELSFLIWVVIFYQSTSMTFESSTLQIQRQKNLEYCLIFRLMQYNLLFYNINLNVVSLLKDFVNSSFFSDLKLCCIDILYQFKWINIVYVHKKWKKIWGLNLVSLNNISNSCQLSYTYRDEPENL
jgi:hypothetical protein